MAQTERNTEDSEMSFLDHLEALRWHLIRSIIAVVVFSIAAFVNKAFFFDGVILAPKNTDFWSYRMLCRLSDQLHLGDQLCVTEINFEVFNLNMAGQFTAHIIISFAIGIIIAFPYIMWEMWRFIKPALHARERKYATGIVGYTSLLFFIGVLFGYFILTPISIQFLGNYNVSMEVANQINLGSYISTVSGVVFATAIVFELPIIIYFLTKIGLVTPAMLRGFRKHSLIVILLISAILTPPDLTSQLLLSIPFYLLYEVSILVSARVMANLPETGST
ncbi:MAG: twin-arginine translocase subunit TatC [Bacteroidia bacterium]